MRWKATESGVHRSLETQAADAVADPPTVSAPPRPARPPAAAQVQTRKEGPGQSKARWTEGRWPWVLLGGILAVAAGVRIWQIAALGYNSDEAVYSGQAATIAHVNGLDAFFPAFRAHPLLIQTLLSIGYRLGGGEVFGRVAMALVGVATVFAVYWLGDLLYGRRAGLAAALLLALMPYHVVVTRQVLLDGPMTFFATVTLYLLALFATTRRVTWLYAAAGAMGLTFLSKETAIVMLGSIYAFLALTPRIRVQLRHLAGSFGVFVLLAPPCRSLWRSPGRRTLAETSLPGRSPGARITICSFIRRSSRRRSGCWSFSRLSPAACAFGAAPPGGRPCCCRGSSCRFSSSSSGP